MRNPWRLGHFQMMENFQHETHFYLFVNSKTVSVWKKVEGDNFQDWFWPRHKKKMSN